MNQYRAKDVFEDADGGATRNPIEITADFIREYSIVHQDHKTR